MIASYNQAGFLHESIERVLGQSYPHVEVVVVDDGSTDGSRAIVERYPEVRLIRQENAGVSTARNTGAAAASGELIVFLDSDDRLPPAAIETGVGELAADPVAAFAAGRYRLIDVDGTPGKVYDWDIWGRMTSPIYDRLVGWNFIGMLAAVMFRREALPRVPFDGALPVAEDWDLLLTIVREKPVRLYDEVVAKYRRHGASISRNWSLMLTGALAVWDRQRGWVGANRELVPAFRDGLGRHRAWSGDRIVDDVLHSLRDPARRRTFPAKVALPARQYPMGAVRRVTDRVMQRVTGLLLSLVSALEGVGSVATFV